MILNTLPISDYQQLVTDKHGIFLPVTKGAINGACINTVTGYTASIKVVEAIHTLITLVALYILLTQALASTWVTIKTFRSKWITVAWKTLEVVQLLNHVISIAAFSALLS